MSDLTEITSTESIKIIGADLTAAETYPINANSGGRLFTESTIIDGTYGPAQIDQYALVLGTIRSTHKHIHEGKSFNFSDWQSKNHNQTIGYVLNVPANCYPHITFDVICNQQTTIDFYENANIALSTQYSVYNRNRNSAITPNMGIYAPGTITSLGTKIFTSSIGAQNQGLASKSIREEWILKPSTKYYFLITAINDSDEISSDFNWYEL